METLMAEIKTFEDFIRERPIKGYMKDGNLYLFLTKALCYQAAEDMGKTRDFADEAWRLLHEFGLISSIPETNRNKIVDIVCPKENRE